VTVRLLFRPDLAAYASEKAWHPRQKLRRRRDGSVELTLPVLDVRDVKPWVLSLGAAVRVLAPKALREAVKAESRAVQAV
jgi:predicted DNA-binding transcriptional regulator YafY